MVAGAGTEVVSCTAAILSCRRMNRTRDGNETVLRRLLDAALEAADPARCVPPHLPPPPKGRTIVVGAGKAAATMARAVEDHWPGALSGIVVTRYGHGVPCRRIEVVEASHPVPDAAGADAARRILASVAGPRRGRSRAVPHLGRRLGAAGAAGAAGLTLDDKRAVTRALLRSGAAIGEINCVRKHLSAIKGGRLAAAAAPAHGRDAGDLGRGRATIPPSSAQARPCPILPPSPMRAPSSRNTHRAAASRRAPPRRWRATRRRSRAIRCFARCRYVLVATPQHGARRRRRCRARGRRDADRARRPHRGRGARGGEGHGRHRAPGRCAAARRRQRAPCRCRPCCSRAARPP